MTFETYHLFFKNLSNALKMRIVFELKNKNLPVNELVNRIGVEQSKLSHALTKLKCCNIVQSKINGKQRIYRLNKKIIVPMLNLIDKHEKSFCRGLCNYKKLRR